MAGPLIRAQLRIAQHKELTVLGCCAGIEALLGFTAEDFLGSTIRLNERIHRDDADIVQALLRDGAEGGTGTFNIRLRHADGRIRCVKGQYTRQPESDTGPAAIELVLEDAKSLWNISDSEPMTPGFHALMECCDEIICFKDHNHVYTAASRNMTVAAREVDGEAGLLGQTDYDVYPEEFADIYYALEKRVLLGAESACSVHRGRTLDGKPLWFDTHKYPFRNERGEIAGLFGVTRDVTLKMNAQQALEEAELKYRTIFAGALEGMFRTTVDGQLLIANDAAVRMLGYDSQEDARRLVRDLARDLWADPEERQRYLDRLKESETHSVLGYECRFKRKDGTPVWVSMSGRLLFAEDGQPLYHEGFILNVTERKRSEEALRKSEETLLEAQRIAGLGSYEVDLEKGEWKSSEVLDRLIGVGSQQERTMEGWFSLVHPEDRYRLVAHVINDVIPHRRPFDLELRVVRPSDGAVRWIHGLGKLDFDARGRLVKVCGTVQDITAQKQAETALRQSEESLKDAQRIAGLGSYEMDLNQGTWTSSVVLDRLFGIGNDYPRTVDGWAALLHPGDRETMVDYLRNEVIGQGKAFNREYRIVRASDGAVRWVQGLGRLDLDLEGRPQRMVGTIRDTTERKLNEMALRESKELLQQFIDHAPAALAMFDPEMRYLSASRRWLEIQSLHGQNVIGRCHYDVLPEIPLSWRVEHRKALAGEAQSVDEKCMVRRDGSVQWLRREVMPWRTGDGLIGGIVIFAEDITRQRETEDRLRLAASVFTNAREGIAIADASGAILEVNEMFTHITGYTREEVLGKNPRLLQSGLHSPEFYAEMWRSLREEGRWSGEIWNRNKRGEIYAEMLNINAVYDADGKPAQYVALFSDMSKAKEHEKELEHVAKFDVLTGLPNRSLLVERLRQAMTVAERHQRLIGVAYLDLDGFKRINDLHGHEVGDRFLATLAFNLKCAMRRGDTLARPGGDEFVAVFPDLKDAESCLPVLARMLDAAADRVQIGDLSLSVSASIGVTFYPQQGETDAEVLLRQADQAMYQAKLAGGSRYLVFDARRDQSVRGRHEDLERIRQALAVREFELFYQPKVNMRTGNVVGAEALIRWRHPVRGLLPPGLFLPVIEDHAMAIDVGEWVIATALEQMETWHAAGLEIPVSVNVGALQLQQANFVDRLSKLLDQHPRIKPFSLELEVVETSAIADVAQISQVLVGCRKIGVSFALDDFGTGYSSLTYLKGLPTNVIKIDQSFVRDMLDDPENLNILEGILGLASAFHRQVIAEGVETVEHGLMLLQLGCELAQGYGIARPMPAREFPVWAAKWRPDPSWAQAPSIHAGNRSLLYASVEFRAWIAAIEAFVEGKRHSPPLLDYRQCRLGMWLESETQAGRGYTPVHQLIEAIHRRFHSLAIEVVTSRAEGRQSQMPASVEELQELGQALLDQLETLIRSGEGEHPGQPMPITLASERPLQLSARASAEQG